MSEEDYRMLRVLQSERAYLIKRLELAQSETCANILRRRMERIDDYCAAAVEFHIDAKTS